MRQIRIGLIGLGTVGSGVVRILRDQAALIDQQTGLSFKIVGAAVANLDRERAGDLQRIPLVAHVSELINDPSIDVIVEVMGQVKKAKALISAALKGGKHVVTANKDLIAQSGNELAQLAVDNHVMLRYEASVAGGIPILQTLRTVYTADPVNEIAGILNGTTNFILTQMDSQNWSYDQALQAARDKGFAESDPTNDVDGFDAAFKLGILTKIAFGLSVSQSQIEITGIRGIAVADVRAARTSGYELKLVAMAKRTSAGLQLSVAPMVIQEDRPLAKIQNENNAVWVKSANIGTALYVGPGAGQLPTGNSVVTDLVQVGKAIRHRDPAEPFALKRVADLPSIIPGHRSYWVLLASPDNDQLPANVKLLFGDVKVSQPDVIRGLDPHRTLASIEVRLDSPMPLETFVNLTQQLGDIRAAYPVLED
ncbi:homoserine dehydrogenase [Secundilactobacillus folii]|uniref:Homoserine dehydrogenase n=1 Tax=Secundilactobacillus folii TaxID=2678357 RepID=A0A7X2XWG7_9LACO|nr:homoserine dehydrogenase [Secundilactobacillus folii]